MKKLVNGELIDMTDAEIAEVTSEHDVSPFDNLIRELRQARNNKARSKSIKLTQSQVAIAKKLGVPLEEYAKYVKQ